MYIIFIKVTIEKILPHRRPIFYLLKFLGEIGKGRRKKNYKLQTSPLTGGGANPLAVTNIGVFFSEKEKKMVNVLKWKNMEKNML